MARSGYVLFLNNGPMSQGSHKQTCTFGSTTKVEYIASFVPTKEVVWMHCLLSCLGHSQLNPKPLLSNNQSYIHLVHNPEFPRCIKHIDIQFHTVQEKQLIGEINMSYISSDTKLQTSSPKAYQQSSFNQVVFSRTYSS